MLFDPFDDAAASCADDGAVPELRAIAPRSGDPLGWEPAEVASFAASLAGRAWEGLGPDDLLRVIEEYWRLGLAAAARATRDDPQENDRAR
jgi:hypothetical protein